MCAYDDCTTTFLQLVNQENSVPCEGEMAAFLTDLPIIEIWLLSMYDTPVTEIVLKRGGAGGSLSFLKQMSSYP